MQSSVSCGVAIGGSDGFSGTIRGAIDTSDGSAVFAVSHPGGWTAVQGEFSSLFTTPAFAGTPGQA